LKSVLENKTILDIYRKYRENSRGFYSYIKILN